MSKLIKQAMLGDQEAFIRLMEENKPAMLRIAYGFFHQEADIADAMQETILDAYEHLSSLKQPRYFKTWLMRILINNCNNIYRKNKKYLPMEELPEKTCGTEQNMDEGMVRFKELLSCVSEKNRVCFQLYYGEELTTREIAYILHIRESTIRSRMHREKLRLKDQFLSNHYENHIGKEGKQA